MGRKGQAKEKEIICKLHGTRTLTFLFAVVCGRSTLGLFSEKFPIQKKCSWVEVFFRPPFFDLPLRGIDTPFNLAVFSRQRGVFHISHLFLYGFRFLLPALFPLLIEIQMLRVFPP